MEALRIALIGYGEVGGILGTALGKHAPASLRAYDLLFDDPARRGPALERARANGVEPADSAAAAVADATLIVCAVTASQALPAARSARAGIRKDAWYLDLNSASPKTKRECAAVVEGAGGRYVEMAVMTSVPPYGIAVPMLSGGPHARAIAPLVAGLGFRAEIASEELGVASAIKMCRSGIVKGMEAIVIESFIAARRYGVEREVLASLAETFPGIDWEKQGSYFFQRVVAHGKRRAEEMREASVTYREVGLAGGMAAATSELESWVTALKESGTFAETPRDAAWRDFADRIERR